MGFELANAPADAATFEPAWELARRIRARELSPVELVEQFLLRIEKLNPKLKAFITIAAEQARGAAREAEAKAMQGEELPPLHGVPLAVKDTLFTKGIRSTGGSLVYRDFVPEQDAGAVERLRHAGAIVLGKTTTPEFAVGGGLSYNRLLEDDCHNPWNLERSAGASSGGSAAAVAAGLAPIALGSDAGGSIRIPAAWCGVYGLKQTNGRVATHGAFESMPLFNVVGPLTRTVRDAAMMLQAMAGYDARDALSLKETPPAFLAATEERLPRLAMAWSPDLGHPGVDPEIVAVAQSAARRFESLGCTVGETRLAVDDGVEEAFLRIAWADLYAGHGEALEANPQKFTPVLKSIMEKGKRVTGPAYAKALWRIHQFRAQMATFFEEYDVLLTPTVAVRPHKIEEVLRDYAQPGPALEVLSVFTALANITGGPSATVPCGFTSDGLPVGLLLTGRPGDDTKILQLSAAFEELAPWADKRPHFG